MAPGYLPGRRDPGFVLVALSWTARNMRGQMLHATWAAWRTTLERGGDGTN